MEKIMNYLIFDLNYIDFNLNINTLPSNLVSVMEYIIVIDQESQTFSYMKNRYTGEHHIRYDLKDLHKHIKIISFRNGQPIGWIDNIRYFFNNWRNKNVVNTLDL